MKIYTVTNKKEEKILRQKTREFDFSRFRKKEVRELVKTMRQIMKDEHGIGLAANQIGLDISFFVAQPPEGKFYAIFNPVIKKVSGKNELVEEGCLSVPKKYGLIERYEKVTLIGQDHNGKKLKIKARGLLAQIFQHETEHLLGTLYIDKAKKIYKLPENEVNHES